MQCGRGLPTIKLEDLFQVGSHKGPEVDAVVIGAGRRILHVLAEANRPPRPVLHVCVLEFPAQPQNGARLRRATALSLRCLPHTRQPL